MKGRPVAERDIHRLLGSSSRDTRTYVRTFAMKGATRDNTVACSLIEAEVALRKRENRRRVVRSLCVWEIRVVGMLFASPCEAPRQSLDLPV